ncbi:PREDICTED: uncharacterized protein LOC108561843, partial [Nicrophorus vespilloides]|uniref:Uncharacterized protein LOC108561843 n=1 Tax=Nicrophorus vespilloides TaxID=110193 RepID=A0ABM1MLG4_NICVS
MSDKWITKELFEKSLRTFFDDSTISILKYDCKPAVPLGDNYTSDITRALVTYKQEGKPQKVISVIVKIQPRGTIVEEWTIKLNFFKTEMEMFSKTLPLIYKILGPDMNGYLSSLCLLTTDKPNLMLVLDDLKPCGFQMASRTMGFDLEHCLIVMKKIAVFHAASIIMVRD